MILNFRKPIFVILGAWNEAILNKPDWTSKYIYEYAEGDTVNALQVYEENPVTHSARLIQYIEDIGILVEQGRLSFFLNVNINFEDIFTSLEKKVLKVVETLHHTPIGGYGVNFSFEVQTPSDLLLGSFDTADHNKAKYSVKREKHTLGLEFEDGVTLNLSKENLHDRVNLDFNYHNEKFELRKFQANPGELFRYYNKTLDILKSYEVDIENINIVRHSVKEVSNGSKEKNN